MAYIENPFSGYGRAISGLRFIGREKYIRTIENRVTKQKDPNNLALIGYPRIGKSSLAEQAIMQIERELVAEKKIPILISFGTYENVHSFFRTLVIKAYEYLEEHFEVDAILSKPYQKIQDEGLSWTSLKSEVERFFEKATKKDYRFIFVLDEFDSARIIFKDNYAAFQELRELGYRGTFKVTFVTTSRRSIKEIEIQCAANSVLDLIFKKEYLSMYNKSEIDEYFGLYENIKILLTEQDKERIIYYCGGHPYLLAALGFEIVETFKEEGKFSVSEIFEKIRLDFEDYYEQLITLLKEDKTYEKMLQILFGPMLNVTDGDVKELRDIYGLLEEINLPNNDKGLVAFSQHFQEYLSSLGRKIDFWSLWTTLETTMRKVIETIMKKKYEENWQEKLKELFPAQFFGIPEKNIKGAIDKRQYAKEDNKSDNLLDYIDAQPIFEMAMSKEFEDDFKTIFGADKKVKGEFMQKIQLIILIRNPYAHSRFQAIKPTTVQQAEIYCKEILDKINEYLK
jgi:hypothetical protein